MPVYFGGLLLGLAAMVAIFQAKRAMMPKFHEIQEERPQAVIAPGGGVRLIYSDEPGYFLIPGLPTGAVISRAQPDGVVATVFRAQYADLTEKEPLLGPLTEEGKYVMIAGFYICASPGVADCAKYVVEQEIVVDRNASQGESRLEVNLSGLAQKGIEAGSSAEKAN